MIKRCLGALALALCVYTPISGGEKLLNKKDFEGWPNKEYHYDGYIVKINRFLFSFDAKYVRFYEEQEDKVNVLEIAYPDGVFEKYWDKNDDLVPDDVEVIKGRHIALIDCSKDLSFLITYEESEYIHEKKEEWLRLTKKFKAKFKNTLQEIKKNKK